MAQTAIQKRDWKRKKKLRELREQGLEPDDVNDLSSISTLTCTVCHKNTFRFGCTKAHRHYEGCTHASA